MPSGPPGSVACELDEHPLGLLGEQAVRHHVEGEDLPAAGIVDVEHLLVGREGEPVGQEQMVDQEVDGAEIGRHPDTRRCKSRSHCCGSRRNVPGIGEIDRAVGLHHHVVGLVEAVALEAVRDHGDAAVGFLARDPPGQAFAGDQPALGIAGEAVGAVGRLAWQTVVPCPGVYLMRRFSPIELNRR